VGEEKVFENPQNVNRFILKSLIKFSFFSQNFTERLENSIRGNENFPYWKWNFCIEFKNIKDLRKGNSIKIF
jgi:hypothetical protein